MTTEWHPIETAPENVIVETKIDDDQGVRNVAKLKRSGNLWWMANGKMYVYYQPTHWRYEQFDIEDAIAKREAMTQ